MVYVEHTPQLTAEDLEPDEGAAPPPASEPPSKKRGMLPRRKRGGLTRWFLFGAITAVVAAIAVLVAVWTALSSILSA